MMPRPLFALLSLIYTLLPAPAFAQVYEKVFDFGQARAAKGAYPTSELVQGNDGNFYGTTPFGGAFGYGTVFKMTPTGVLTTLVEFKGAPEFSTDRRNPGAYPFGGLVLGGDGNFYGTTTGSALPFGIEDTEFPGFNGGTIFKVTPDGQLTTLALLNGYETDSPCAKLLLASDGNFYFTTNGSVNGFGGIFKMTPAGQLTELVRFTGGEGIAKGAYSFSALVEGADGSFYGTTSAGGAEGYGTIFKVTPNGEFTTLVEFGLLDLTVDGRFPFGALVLHSDGNFYGTTQSDGAGEQGTVFKMTPEGVLTTVMRFGAGNQGSDPRGTLVEGSDGSLYGTIYPTDVATAFKVTPDGTLTNLPVATGSLAGLVQGSDGNFYGTTYGGGRFSSDAFGPLGTVFKMTPSGEVTTLVEFADKGFTNLGRYPLGALVQDGDGNYYGTTYYGGPPGENGGPSAGTVFKLTPTGELTTLVEFGVDANGANPTTALVMGTDGYLYGITSGGGPNGGGTIFRMSLAGELTTLVVGHNSGAGLVQGTDGNFYGADGTVVTPAGLFSVLPLFTGNVGNPAGPLVEGEDGNFYGTTQNGGANDYGTVFKMTPEGQLTTLVEFTGNDGANKGRGPAGPLFWGGDGFFYGSTESGGTYDSGTLFKMTPEGQLTTMWEFLVPGSVGNEGTGGANPSGPLVRGADGFLYGTTRKGPGRFIDPGLELPGSAIDQNYGTVFKMSPNGIVSTVMDFITPSEGGMLAGNLMADAEGNIYGTAAGTEDGGTIFRIIVRGKPSVLLKRLDVQGTTGATVEAQVNARGSSTALTLEYGTDGTTFPNVVSLASGLNGFQTKSLGTSFGGLTLGTTYYYRLRASSSAGTTLSPVTSFTTLAEPVVAASPASEVAAGSARFNGTVNARSFTSTVTFQWGTDGSSFPNTAPATPGTVTGNDPVAVSALVASDRFGNPLTKDTTYYYRIVATNAAGTAVSGTQSFKTLTEPVATLGAAFALTSTSVSVSGSVDARGADAQVFFDYGPVGGALTSVAATPSMVTGNGSVSVSGVLPNLNQVTYRYRVRAESAGGTGLSGEGTASVAVLSGFQQVAPSVLDPRSNAQGFLVVNLEPSNLLGTGWRFVGEQQWRVPGIPAGGLATGNREIEFRPVAGYLHPLREPVSVTSGAAATVVEREYFQGGGVATASLSVTLLPVSLGAAAQWRLLGEDDGAWRASGASLGGLAAGVYLVECKDVAGYTTPRPRSVTIGEGEAKTATATYFLADADVGAQPGVVGFDAVTSATANPFTYVGQLRSDSGSGTGFVVRQRVVATAAHVVFDDGTLSAATGVQWVFQRERGTYEPVPQIPRGSYILSGYSAQRIADATPGTSSVAAQNLDVASVWFYEQDAGRGGSGGYLASDSTDNEWLISPRLKTIVGYPLDGISAANQGRIHATPPINATFGHANARVYLTDDITSRGGNSGGPVCVQYDDGRYFPAAIYLGGTTQTRVRAIDSDVITLFDSAEESSNTGQNSTDGGQSQTNNSLGSTPSGTLTVTIEPQAARDAGAGWRIGSGAFLTSGQSKPYLSAGSYTVTFKSIEGFQTPSARSVSVTGGNTTSISVTYSSAQPPVVTGPGVKRAVRGQLLTFTIAADNDPTAFAVSGLAGTGLTLNTTSGALTGTPQTNGTFTLSATAQNDAGTSAPFAIALIVADPGTLIVQSDPTRGSVIVKPNFPGNILPQGTLVTLTAKAKEPDFLFGGWQFSGVANPQPNPNAPTATFPMTESIVAVANFVPNPYLSRIGTYQGLLISTAGADGIASLKLGKTGTFTMKLTLAGKPYSLAGRLDASGHFTGEIKRPRLTPIPVSLQLNVAALEPRLTGTFTVDNANVTLDAARVTYSKNNSAPAAGKYTFALPPDPAQSNATLYPAGHGYVLASVKATGTVSASGLLGDGTPFSAAGTLGADNVWPVHVRPYGSKGIVAGLITFTQRAAPLIDEANGALRWMKPVTTKGLYKSGFTGSIAALGSRWTPPAKGSAALAITNWDFAIGTSVLPSPITATATLSPANLFTLTGATGTKLTLAPKTGLLSGSFPGSSGKSGKFKGALLQSQRIGRGVFALPDKTAPVTLDPP